MASADERNRRAEAQNFMQLVKQASDKAALKAGAEEIQRLLTKRPHLLQNQLIIDAVQTEYGSKADTLLELFKIIRHNAKVEAKEKARREKELRENPPPKRVLGLGE